MKCYSCSNDAVQECRRCGKLYCDEHGDELCAECLKPAGALPSFLLYRGSLLALLVGTAFALWLLLKPPEQASQSEISIVQPTATTAPARTPAAGTPAPTATIAAAATATPSATTYTVQEGDTLFDIAALFQPPGESITDYADRLAVANDLDPASPLLHPGQTLTIPK
ncbi:MAG TPA: LysM peptidoglycan-binding domain-containing protein [Dehalococcoidia bacterium]|nr:LysM peptidoglycan-binding domain-containing protein [Dehalococcoidia bacterium]